MLKLLYHNKAIFIKVSMSGSDKFFKNNWRSSEVFWYGLFIEHLCVYKRQHNGHYVSD